MNHNYSLAMFPVLLACVAPIPAGHAAQLQDETASPPRNNVDFQGRPFSLPLTHSAPGFTLPAPYPPKQSVCVCVGE